MQNITLAQPSGPTYLPITLIMSVFILSLRGYSVESQRVALTRGRSHR